MTKEVSADACELPTEEREEFLRVRCQGKADLRRSVETLLRAHDEAGRFLAVPTRDLRSDDGAIGQHIGRYKLLQAIGEGGCGVVYVAEQEEPVRRRVALKVIKLGMDTQGRSSPGSRPSGRRWR